MADSGYIDVYNDLNVRVGVADKRTAHERGLWHRVFTCVLLNPKTGTVFLQKKYPGGYSAFDRPDYLDVSVGGHYEAGEGIEDGIREIREELGLNVAYRELVPLGVRQTAATLSETYIANEFQYIHLLPYDFALDGFTPPDQEVRGLVEITVADGIALLTGRVEGILAKGRFAGGGGKVATVDLLLGLRDFPPNYLENDQFMLRLFIAAHRFLKREPRELLFW